MTSQKIRFGSPRFKAYPAIKNFFETYQDRREALCDELIQNFADKAKEEILANPFAKPQMIMKFKSNNGNYEVITEQFNTGGIVKREDYIVFASTQKKTQHGRPSGSRGQGWKIWWVTCNQINTETNVPSNIGLKYFQHQVRNIDHENEKIDWAEGWATDEEFFPRSFYENGAKITFKGVDEDHFQIAEKSFKNVCMSRYNFTLRRYENIKIIQEKLDGSSITIEKPYDINFSENIEEVQHINYDVPGLNNCVLENVFIGFTEESILPFGWKEGVAIIVRDRIVCWIKPSRRLNDGKVVGWVDADFLYDVELTTHDNFGNYTEWRVTKRLITEWIEEIELRAIEYFKGVSKDIHFEQSTALKSIGSLISQTLGVKEEGRGKSYKKKKTESSQIIDNFVLKDSSTNEILEKDTNLYRNKSYIAEIALKNENLTDLDCFIEIASVPKDFNETKKVTLKRDDKIEEKFTILINPSLKRGNYTLTCKIKENIKNKIRKELDSKKITFNLDRIIQQFDIKFPRESKNIIRGEKLELEYKLDGERLNEDTECIVEILKENEPNIIPFQFKSKYSPSINIPEIKQTIPIEIDQNININWEPGDYIAKLTLRDTMNKIIDRMKENFSIENFIKNFGVALKDTSQTNIYKKKLLVTQDQPFNINCCIENIINKPIDGKIKIKISGKHRPIELDENYFEDLSAGKSMDFKFEHRFNEYCDKGSYLIELFLEVNDYVELQKAESIVILEEEDTGLLITYSKNLDEEQPARKRIDNQIEINTKHYLFKKLDTSTGIDLIHFWEGIAILIWEAWRDEFEELNIPYWKWEQIFIEKFMGKIKIEE